MEISLTIAPIAILLFLTAFFGAAETALTAASQPRMIELERLGERRAGIVNTLRSNRQRMIGSILTAQNIVGPLASVLTTALFIGWLGVAGEIYATVTLSLLFIVFGEVLPKTYALYAPDRSALAIAPTIAAVVRILGPLTAAVEWVVRRVLSLFGLDMTSGPRATTEEELRGVISLHKGADPEVETERKMLHSILDLGDVTVAEIMTHRSGTAMIDVEKSWPVIQRQVLASPYSRLPVYRGNSDNIIGVLHAKDLLRVLHRSKGGGGFEIEKILAQAWFIPESTSLLDQLREFRRRREHFALVVDEYGTFEGVVTLEDILEEIVGKIGEGPHQTQGVSGIRAGQDGSYIVNGDVTIRDLNRELGWDLPDDRAATAAGLVMHEAQRIPEVRQVFAFHGFRFEILRRKNNRITALRIRPMEGVLRRAEAPRAGAPAAPDAPPTPPPQAPGDADAQEGSPPARSSGGEGVDR